MNQVKIKDFTEGDMLEGFYAVKDASLQTTASGKSYIRITLSDSTGAISGNLWDASRELFATFAVGSIIKTRFAVESYRGKLQVKLDKLRLAAEEEIDYSEFIPVTSFDISELWEEFYGYIATIADADYKRILEFIFADSELCERFRRAPAAKNNHHAFIGGLLEHTVSLLRYAAAFVTASPQKLDRDLLLAGTMLHDIGKIEELGVGVIIEYTDKGKLLGHLIIGSMLVEKTAGALRGFPEEKKCLLQHMILSHHGKFEYGSPVLPAIPEAFALHHLDNLDAKTVAACRILAEDESGSSWTERSWMLDTMLYKQGCGNYPETSFETADSIEENAVDSTPVHKEKRGALVKDTPREESGSLF